MIVAVGTDIVEIRRIEQAMRNPRFVERILTPRERLGALSPSFVAGRWAAKEAIAKSFRRALRWQDVEILVGENGKPIPTLAKWILPPHRRIHLSISHERHFAVAMSVLEEVDS